MLAVQPPEDQNSTAPAGEEASPLEEAAVIIFSPPEYNYFELGPWEDIAGCWNSWPNATWSCLDPFCCGADIYYSERTHEYFDSRWQPLHFAGTKVGERGAPPPEDGGLCPGGADAAYQQAARGLRAMSVMCVIRTPASE